MLKRPIVLRVAAVTLAFTLGSFFYADAGVMRGHPAAMSPFAHKAHQASSGVDWPQLGFDSGHSAYNPYETTIGPKNVSQLQTSWSFSTGSGNNAGNVVEASGVVYAPSSNGTIFALDAGSGTQVWSLGTGAGYATSGSAPAYDSGMLLTVCNTGASTQGICALNAANAMPLWSYTFPGSAAYAGTPPVVSDGALYYEGCASSCSYVALNEQTGAVLWTVPEPQGSCEGNGGITPAVAYKLLYVGYACNGSQGGTYAALRTKNGKPKWTSSDNDIGQNDGLSVADDLVAIMTFTGCERLLGVNAKKGTFLWFQQSAWCPASAQSMPAITKRDVYVTARQEYVVTFKPRNGNELWGQDTGTTTSWPSVANGVVYLACGANPCAYDADTGQALLSGTGSATTGAPIIVNGAVYGACQGNNVCAWTPPSQVRRRR